MNKNLRLDTLVLALLILVTSLYPWAVRGTAWNNPMLWAFVVAIPIAIFLGLRKKKNWAKIFTGGLVFGLVFGTFLEFMAHINFAWQVPATMFGFRIMGASTLDAIIGYIPMTILVLVIYEHFFDRDINHKISSKIWFALIPALIVIAITFLMYAIYPQALQIPFFYSVIGILAVIVPVVDCYKNPKLFRKYSALAVSLFFVFFLFETVGVAFDYWIFPGQQYLGMVAILGKSFPLEEIVFWMFFYPATIAAYYENFIDDEK